jgi:uncharacterized protein YyaL (SSP411 family)
MNRLSKESSPYLQQHKNNPVDWFPWGEEAFAKAKAENKPILISIGYSTCHWCHVMERESFEDEIVAAIMNEKFVNIKIDREERPDIDSIYIEAVQIMTGSGGWPLNCFLLPDGRPFYGGTYYPATENHNRPSWKQVLQNISETYKKRYEEVVKQADKLTNYVKEADNKLLDKNFDELRPKNKFDKNFLNKIFDTIQNRFDKVEGGFGTTPKFPNTMSLRFCLNHYYFTNNETAINQVTLALDKMIQGGIYDQIGGGFARYATDKAWLIPHFEKMLYDNALLVSLLSDVYKITKKQLYKDTIIETLTFIEREMFSIEGGFYTAQDADSEEKEGQYYVWQKIEIENILGEAADLFCLFYDVSEAGNWEGVNILNRKQSFIEFAKANNLELKRLQSQMAICRAKLYEVRRKRIKPKLDDKILLNWNALMSAAFLSAYTALGNEKYLEIAEQNLNFINHKMKGNRFYFHTYKKGIQKQTGFLDDYALLIDTLLKAFDVTQNENYLKKATKLSEFVIEHYFDDKTNLFYFTSKNQENLIVRKKNLYDNALPSGNSTMVHNLLKIGILTDNEAYKRLVIKMLNKVQSSIEKYPTSFANWATAMQFLVYPLHEIAIIGKDAMELSTKIQAHYIPNYVLMATEIENNSYPLLRGKVVSTSTLIYVCQNYACQLPVKSVKEVLEKIRTFPF